MRAKWGWERCWALWRTDWAIDCRFERDLGLGSVVKDFSIRHFLFLEAPELRMWLSLVTYNVEENRLSLNGAAAGEWSHKDDEGSSANENIGCRSREFGWQFHVFVELHDHPYAYGQDGDPSELLANRIHQVVTWYRAGITIKHSVSYCHCRLSFESLSSKPM